MIEDLAAAPLAYRLADLAAGSGLFSPENAATLGAAQALALMAALLLKHFICDFLFQTNWQAMNKGRYAHPAGLVHTGQHVIGTAVVLFGLPLSLYAGILVVEALVHYHIDWAKDRLTRAAGLTPANHMFWTGIGFDQLTHHMTYVVMAAVVLLSL